MRIRLQGSSHAVRLLSELNRCRLSRLLCDVVLQVGGRSFPAHRAVLACSCTHFHSLFSQAPRTSLSLDFVSATNFEKVLTFIYTGEIFTDLIDVRVLYELAERLGVRELVQACHATFPDLQSSSMGLCSSDRDLDTEVASTGALAVSVCSSSAASCSSLSSSAVPTPATPSPLPQGKPSRLGQPHATSLSLSPKAEDLRIEYSQVPDSKPSSDTNQHSQEVTEGTPVLSLQLKMEVEEEEVARGGCMEERTEKERSEMEETQTGVVSGTKTVVGTSVTLSRVSEVCSFPDSSAQFSGETCAPSSSCGEPLDGLSMGAGEGEGDGDGVVATIFEEEEAEENRRTLQVGEQPEEPEQWRGLAEEIIELSDEEERYLEEEEEEVDEDLVFVENGSSNGIGGTVNLAQESGMTAQCKACGQALPADATAIRAHAETHLTETGECRVCGAAFPELSASVTHALSHVGILLFSCDMCQLQFCSQAKLVRHRRLSAAHYSLPTAEQLNTVPQSQGGEVQCAVCTKHIAKDFKAVREHLLTHVCAQSLRCTVCQLPQPSLCALLWHTLTHLSLAAFSCPVCACGFLERPLLDRHMALHADASVLARGGGGGPDGANGLEEDYRCFLCPQNFSSAAAFHSHLSAHAGADMLSGSQGWPGLRKRKHDTGPDFSSSLSSSPLDGGGLSKLNLGFGLSMGMGIGVQDKMLQGGLPCFPGGLLPNSSSSDPSGVMAPKQKWYRCRYCGKRFAHSGEFTYHLRIHTGEKPYQCKVCLRYFRGRSTMICHLKTHSGALMYRCTVCGLYFSTLKLVSSHMELHKDHLPPDFNIEQTFMYNDHSKEPLSNLDVP